MDLKEQIDQYNKYPNSNTFREKINQLEQQMPAILDDYKKYYIFFNKNPEVSEYQRSFENIENNMREINNNLANIATNISETIGEMNNDLLDLNEKIENEKVKNKRLNKVLGNVKNEQNGANEMIDDYTETYNMFYLRNIAMIVGVIGSFFIAKKVVN